jgi:hypothetical protein
MDSTMTKMMHLCASSGRSACKVVAVVLRNVFCTGVDTVDTALLIMTVELKGSTVAGKGATSIPVPEFGTVREIRSEEFPSEVILH